MKKNKLFRHLFTLIVLTLCIVLTYSCNKNNDKDVIPNVPVSIRVNMELPLYSKLLIPGNYIYLEGGNKGITLFHGFDDQYYATDRICPYQPFDACSKVELDSNFTFRCGSSINGIFEQCCASKFQYDGQISNGPAIYPLKSYRVYRSGNILDIAN
ncbi:MAG: hypothetical protein M0R38_05505 [Bacteroidia bacterium]|nr:hypothetical protein [Bacteroidia bacterium]